MKGKRFIISTHGFDMGIGGLKVLHKLCHMLNTHGYDAYVIPVNFDVPFVVYEPYNVKLATNELLANLQDAIVVYPESWYGNYLNAPNVVRWILGPPDKSHVDTWASNDLWFWLTHSYMTNFNKDNTNILHITEQHRDIFFDKHIPRSGSCWTLRKAQHYVTPNNYMHPKDSIFIPYNQAGDLIYLSDLFNRSEVFYCYDNYTYLTVQSLMCNTDTIVISQNCSRDHFMKGYILNKYVAFGLDDVERARQIRGGFINDLDLLEANSINQIHTFAQKCYDYFK